MQCLVGQLDLELTGQVQQVVPLLALHLAAAGAVVVGLEPEVDGIRRRVLVAALDRLALPRRQGLGAP